MKIKANLFILSACLLLLSSIGLQAEYWQKITNLPANVSNRAYWLDIYFLESDPNYGWICGQYTNQILRTTDGGDNWEVSLLPSAADFTESIHFVDELHGLISGPHYAYRTNDGGATWTSCTQGQNAINTRFTSIWGCYMLSKDTMYVVGGGCDSVTNLRLVWRTTNGGTTWNSYDLGELDIPPSYGQVWERIQRASISDIIVYPNGTGFVVGGGIVYKTTNFGDTWEALPPNNWDGTVAYIYWQEEISNIQGTNVLLTPWAESSPCYQDNEPFGQNGGMLWSNNGINWTRKPVNAHMYGTFLNSTTEGWACGVNRHIFRTLDAGRTWDTTNCGIEEGDDLDDIRFITKNNGWVVGTGIYRTAPTEAFVLNEHTLGSVCATGTFLDTNQIVTKTYNKAHFTFNVLQNDPFFRVISPRENTMLDASACSNTDFVVEFATQNADPVGIVGTHEFAIEIEGTFENETTTFIDTIFYTIEVTPYDVWTSVDTLDLGTIVLGSTTTGSVNWTTSTEATISLNTRTGNDNNGYCTLTFPNGNWNLSLIQQNAMEFSVTPVLTGEYLVRYNFIVLPCNLEKDVYVKFNVEGLELETQPDYTIDMICKADTVLAIPISNEGVLPVSVLDVYHKETVQALELLGFGQDSQLPPFIMPTGQADTMFIQISSQNMQNFTDTIWVEISDTEDEVSPILMPISVNVNFLYPSVAQQTTILDFGNVCINTTQSKQATIRYNGSLITGITYTNLAEEAFQLVSGNVSTPPQPNSDLLFDINFTPIEAGLISDTIHFTTALCNYTFELIVQGEAVRNEFEYSPASINEQINVGESENFSLSVTSLSSHPVTVTSIRTVPAVAEISLTTLSPFVLSPGETTQIEFTASSNVGKIVTCSLEVVCDGASTCIDTLLFPVRIEFVNTKVAYRNNQGVDIYSVDNSQLCSFTKRYDTLLLSSTSDFVLHNVSLFNNSPEFQIESNLTFPTDILAGVPFPVIISTQQAAFGSISDKLMFELENAQSGITWVDTMPLNSDFTGSSLSISKNDFDFGMFETCNIPIYQTFTIKNNGNTADTCYIDVAKLPACLTFSDTKIIVEANDSVTITITCDPSQTVPITNYIDSVLLYSTVCLYQTQLSLKYHSDSIALNVEPQSIDLGEVWAHTAQTSSVTLSNPSPFDIEITSITVEPAGGFSVDVVLPFTLSAGASINIPVNFISATAGAFNSNISIVAKRQCEINLDVPIKAFVPEEQYFATIEWNRITAFPGQTISLEATVTSAASPSVFPAALDFYIKMNYSLFYPTRLLVINDENTFEEINFDFDINNGIKVRITGELASNLLNFGRTIFKLEGQVLISTITQTPVWFDQFIIETDKYVSPSLVEGLLQLPELCASDEMLGELAFAPTFAAQIEEQVIEETLNVEFNADGNIIVNYDILDLLGNNVLTGSINLSEGKTEKSIDLWQLSAGTYFIKFSSDFNYPLSSCILITR